MSATRILVIEDDPDIVELVRYNLENEGYQVESAEDGKAGLDALRQGGFDLVILDLMLPQLSGLEVCKEIRREKKLEGLPVIMLTARGEEADRVIGLELGADDYLTKPFSVREIVARVKALMRRAGREPTRPEPERALSIGPLHIDPSTYRVQKNGENVPLTALEFRLLYFLAARPGRVFTRDQLLDAVWGTERFVTPRSVDVYIRRLREKIEENPMRPVFLKTLRGAGYSFEGPR
jgi:two-component system alkaline phosphatase synthesis response regulator PhoP